MVLESTCDDTEVKQTACKLSQLFKGHVIDEVIDKSIPYGCV